MLRLARRIALSVIPLALLAQPAAAGRNDPCVTPSGTIYAVPLTPDGSLRVFMGDDLTPFGKVVGILQLHFNAGGTFTGEFAFEARGGAAFGTVAGYFTSASTFQEILTIEGGTGKYGRTRGDAEVSGTLNPDGSSTDTVEGGLICTR